MALTGSAKAEVTLPTDEQILITRRFAAPPALVWRAYTTPELVRRWWSGRQGRMTVAEIDLRVGGAWRYVMVGEGGHEVAFHGEFREVVPHERLVSTEVYEAMPEGVALTTVTFTAEGAGTTLALLMDMGSRQARDGILQSGMETGVQEQMELLDELFAELG
jgi:uncharacterized protein YndB with AHSA1/START domain